LAFNYLIYFTKSKICYFYCLELFLEITIYHENMQITNNKKINSNNLDKIFTFVSVYVGLKISEGLS